MIAPLMLVLACANLLIGSAGGTNFIDRSKTGELFYSHLKETQDKLNISQVNYVTTSAKYKSMLFNDFYIHHYKHQSDLKQSTSAFVADQERCLAQLIDLRDRTELLLKQKFNSKDINLYRLLDTYGRISSGFLKGNIFLVGQYNECLKLRIKSQTYGSLKTRFCWALLRHNDWPIETESYAGTKSIEAIKLGVCLPATCDSLDYKNKYKLINYLINFSHRDVERDTMSVNQLYCLPDEESPLRENWPLKSIDGSLTLLIITCWIGYIIHASLKFSKIQSARDKSRKRVVLANDYEFYKPLSITENFKHLVDISIRVPQNGAKYSVNLDVIDGLKVLILIPMIGASHSLIYSNAIWTNVRDTHSMLSPLWTLTHLNTGFAVSGFMVISATLTSYSLFKKHQKKPFIENPFEWLDLIVHRYLRLSVVYIFTVAFGKYIGQYLNSGPFWDYGTSEASPRKLCHEESWIKTLLMFGNFYSPIDQCIPSGWYVASEFQFFLVTPIFLYLINMNQNLGRKFILSCIGFTWLFTSLETFLSTGLENPSPAANYRPDGFLYTFKYLTPVYTHPWHRIGAYLIGLLLGHLLFRYELEVNQSSASESRIELPFKLDLRGPKLCCLLLFVHLAAPYFARGQKWSDMEARVAMTIFLPLNYLLVSSLVGTYLLLSATGRGSRILNKLLSASIWRPFARLALCNVIVQFEWLQQSNQSSVNTQEVTSLYLARMFVSNQVWTCIISIFVFLLIEEPGRRVLESAWNGISRSIRNYEIVPDIHVKCT